MANNNFFDRFNSIRKQATKMYNGASTSVYRNVRKLSEKVDKIAKGDETDKSAASDRDYKKKMFAQMSAGVDNLLDYQLTDDNGLSFDANRKNFGTIDKDEYSDPTEVSSVVEEIEDFLTGRDNKGFFEQEEPEKKFGKKEVIYDESRLRQAQKFQESFAANKLFGFNEKNEMLKGQADVFSQSAVDKYGLLNRVVDAFTGDKEAIDKIKEEPNQALAKNFSNVIRSFLKGDMDEKTAGNNLFMQIHGIDYTKMQPGLDTAKIVSLVALQENHQDAKQFEQLDTKTIKNLNELVSKGNVNPSKILLGKALEKIFQDTYEKGDQIKDLVEDPTKCTNALYFENEGNGNIGVTYFSEGNDMPLVARRDREGNYLAGSEENLMNAMTRSKDVQDVLNERPGSELDKIIDDKTHEARKDVEKQGPMDAVTLAAYNKEVEDALAFHQNIVKQNYTG